MRLLLILGLAGALVAGCLMWRAPDWSGTRTIAAMPSSEKIEFVAGLEWRAVRPDFGGISGLHIADDGQLTAVTDKAHWVEARMVRDAEGRMLRLEDLRLRRMKNAEGEPLDRQYADSESLSLRADGAWVVSFEDRHRISIFASLDAPEAALQPQPELMDVPLNGGIESVLSLPDGRTIAVAETSANGMVPYKGWIISEQGIAEFLVMRRGWFAPTDLALGPDGKWVYLLERRFTVLGGFAMRLRRFALDTLQADAHVKGELLIELSEGIDNMEGLAALRAPDGGTFLFVISDDNFQRVLERTLILQFRVRG